MPITIKSTELKYKNPSTGQYQGVDAVAEMTTSEQCALIEVKGAEVIESIPSDYTALSTKVGSNTLDTTAQNLSDAINEHESDVSALNTALIARQKNGATNLLPYPYLSNSGTDHGMTYTVNSDGSVTMNGTSSGGSVFLLSLKDFGSTSFNSKNVSTAAYKAYLLNAPPTVGLVYFQSTKNTIIEVPDGTSVSNVTVYPMICLAEDAVSEYQKYAPTNADLLTETSSVEWRPSATSTVLDFVLAKCTRLTLPFSFCKVGNATVSDIPSEIASAEFNGLVYGHGDRLIVQINHYTVVLSKFFQRTIYQNAWRDTTWCTYLSLDAPTLQYSGLTIYTGFTREGGGYYRFGRLVSLNIVLTNSSNATINLSGKAIVTGLPPASNDYGNNRQVGAVTVGGVGVSAIAPTSFSLVTYTDRAIVYGDHTIAVNIPAGVTFSISAVYIANK